MQSYHASVPAFLSAHCSRGLHNTQFPAFDPTSLPALCTTLPFPLPCPTPLARSRELCSATLPSPLAPFEPLPSPLSPRSEDLYITVAPLPSSVPHRPMHRTASSHCSCFPSSPFPPLFAPQTATLLFPSAFKHRPPQRIRSVLHRLLALCPPFSSGTARLPFPCLIFRSAPRDCDPTDTSPSL